MSKEKISIPEIIDLMVKDKNITKKTADEFIRMLISTIEDALLSGDSVKVKGLGTFKPQWNEARRSVDVNTGNEIIIPGFYRVVFAPENDLKDLINEPFAHLETILLADEEPNVKEKQINTSENEERTVVKSDVNLSFLTTQAAEIKEILSDINALSGKKDTQEPKEIDKEDTELSAINSEVIADNEDVYEEEDDWNVEEENEDNLTVEDDEDEPKTPVSQQEDESDEPEEDEFIENDDFDIVRDVSVLYHSESAENEEKTVGEEVVEEEDNQILIIQNEEEIQLTETTDESLSETAEEIILYPEEIPVYTKTEDENLQLSSVSEEITSEETPAQNNTEVDSDEYVAEKLEPIIVNKDAVSDDLHKEIETEIVSSLSQDSHLEEDTKKKNILGLSILIGSLLVLGLGAFLLAPYISRSMKEKKNQERLEYIADSLENIKRVQFIKDSVIPKLKNDSLSSIGSSEKSTDSVIQEKNTKTDTIISGTSKVKTSQQPESPAINRNIYSTPRTYKEVLATEKMVVGSQLTKFARQYYGHPNFWVYIYEANKDKISDPNNVPAGIDVKIPKMDSRLVDPQNKESMNYALTLQSQYLK